MFSFSKKQHMAGSGPPSRELSLDCVPVKNPELVEREDEKDELCLTYPVTVKPWFQGIFKTVSKSHSNILERKLQLDALGTSVWKMIDGQASVNDIIQAFQAEHMLNRREAEISVTTFIKQLGRRGLLAMREGKRG